MGRKTFKFIGVLALVIMICYQAAIIRYTHIHIINGIVITHFHWVSPGEKQTHEHSASDLARIDVLFHYISTTLPVTMTFFFLTIFIRRIYEQVLLPSEYTELISESLRGPPYVS